MVKNKALPDSARLCTPRLVTLSLSLTDLALSRLISCVFSLSLSLSLSRRRRSSWGYPLDPTEAGPQQTVISTHFWVCEWGSHSVVSDSLRPHGLYSQWNSPGQNTGVGSFSLLQGIFPTQELNQGLLHCRRIFYQLSYEGSQWLNNISLYGHTTF